MGNGERGKLEMRGEGRKTWRWGRELEGTRRRGLIYFVGSGFRAMLRA
jgi:hypothetical protein